jgi:hypothetical protein
MVQIFDKRSGSNLGTLDDDQFQYLADRLEEESSDDDDYYLNRATVDILEEEGADPVLVALLRRALGNGEEAEIRWERS